MIERVKTIAPAITRTRNLTIEDLKSLKLPLLFQGELVIVERSLSGNKLRTPISIELEKILAAKEKGLVDYIFKSCLNERPSIIPYIFDYKSMLKLSRHFLRYCSGSHKSCMLYAVGFRKYAEWLGYGPDVIIQDVKPVGAIPDPQRVQNHNDNLETYLAELQDEGLKPGAVNNLIKAVKTFYRVNGVKIELREPLKRRVTYKDRAPKPEETALMLDKAPTRDAFIVAGIATGGFREGTFAKLKYRHVKEDLEANRIPIHVHVEAAITKGKYHDYDTFLNAEASNLLKLYIEERRQGSRYTPPEEITDESPLIRNSHVANKVLGVTEKSIRTIIHTLAVEAKIAKKLPQSWMYSVRTHSLRKYFRTQMGSAKIDTEIVEYMMGHTVNTYEDVQSLGIDKLRNLYVSANIAIRPKTQVNKIEQLKEIIRAWGENPEAFLAKEVLMRGNITETNQLSLLAEQLKQVIKREVST